MCVERPGMGVDGGVKPAPPCELSTLRWVVGLLPRLFLRLLQTVTFKPNNVQLMGASEPVATEHFTTSLDVTGTIPPELNGLYVRTGPNPQVMPAGGYHLFDGEAMLHAVYFSDGKAKAYHNHWLRCPRFLAERAAKAPLWLRLGDMCGAYGVALLVYDRVTQWRLPAIDKLCKGPLGNTALVFHGRKLLALMEGGLPYVVKVCKGVLASVGVERYGGALQHAVTAHPKVDPVDGVMHAFCYTVDGPPDKWCVYNQVTPEGVLSPDVSINISAPQMMHDCAMTEHYVVFFDHALVFDGEAMVRTGGLPFVSDREKQCRIGLLRKAEPERGVFQWFDVDNFVVFHTINAWEESDGRVCVAACRMPYIDLKKDVDGDQYIDGARPTRWTLDVAAGKCVAEDNLAPDCPSDFPVVAAQRLGRPQRYAYLTRFIERPVKRQGALAEAGALMKLDLFAPPGKGHVATIDMPDECFSEPFFVPRDAKALAAGAADIDDGFLVVYATNMKSWTSTCRVFDAKSMSAEPLATVKMPRRVPAGFHGLFVSQADLDSQDAAVKAPQWPLAKAVWAR